jgi:polysaccharide pyruvyl transferase WcaK-like protein
MPTALLVGPFGAPEPGADAALGAFRQALPGWRTIVACGDPAALEAEQGRVAVDLNSRRALLRALLRADATILAGYPLDAVPDSSLQPGLGDSVALLAASKALGRPTALVGVGAGPLTQRRARTLSRWLVRVADLLVLRDDASARQLERTGAAAPFRVGADPAWLALDGVSADAPRRPAGPSSVVVALDRRAGGGGLVRRLAAALKIVAAAGVEVKLQPWTRYPDDGGDHGLAAELGSLLDSPVQLIAPLDDLRQAPRALAGSDVVLALAPHALIAGAAAAIPSVAIAGQPGTESLARRLEQPVLAASSEPATIAETILASLDRQPPPEGAKRREIATAKETFRLLRLLLSEGESDGAGEISGLSLRPRGRA